MPTIRVYELAKEMDMNSKVLLDTMIEMGLPMKNHMSTIPGNEVSRIRAMVMKHLGDPNAEPIPRPVEKKEKPPLSGLRNRPSMANQGADQSSTLNRSQNRPAQTVVRGPERPRPGQGGYGGNRPGQQGRPGGQDRLGQQSRPGGQARPGQGMPGSQGRPDGQGRTEQDRAGRGVTGPGRPAGQQRPDRGYQGGAIAATGGADGAGAGGAGAGAAGGMPQGAQAQAQAQVAARRQPGESISPQEAQAQAQAQVAARRQPGESISPQEAQAQAQAQAQALAQVQAQDQAQAPPRRQPGESISPQEAQAQAQVQAQALAQVQAQDQAQAPPRRQPGDSISPQEAQAQARARRQPGDSISPQEAQAQLQGRRQAPDAGTAQSPAGTAAAAARAQAGGAPARPAPPRPQGASTSPGASASQGAAATRGPARPAGQGFGQARPQAATDKYARTPGQAKPAKPKRPPTPADNRQKGFNKGPKAPTIGRDTADQLAHLGSATEEDSRFLNKVENAVGEKAYDRGGITRTPSRKQNRYEDSRTSRPRSRSGKDRGRQSRQEPAPVVIKNITLDGPTTVLDFAHLLGKKTGDIIKKLISYGIMANINQELDVDTLILLGQDFGTQVETKITKEEILTASDEPDAPEDLRERPPVVTIMGHVDHGKTSLLDAIRQANVQASEAGGITQHIGAYQVEINNRRITFLDTPGHEAFTAMRARGAQCTDIAILVVAADDGVMPQTVEAVNHAKAANVPIIVAVNKVDKEGANPEKVKQELTEYGLLAEEWGGDTVFAEVSAKTRQGLDQLLEMILLVADVGDLKANPDRKAKGVVIEAKLDRGRGPVATILVQNGTLESGDFIIAGTAQGRIRAMNDENGRQLKQATPSMPVEVIGLSEVPQAGDFFQVVADERLAKQIASERTAVRREEVIHSRSRISLEDLFAQIQTGEVKDLNIIIKADVQGSIEALRSSLDKLSNDEVRVQTIHQGVGGITEADVDFASASNAIILGFNVRPDANARKSAETNQVDIRLYRVIYNAIEDVKSALSGLLTPEIRENIIGRAEVRQVIRVPKVGPIAGCYILDGKIARGCLVRVIRDNIVIHEGNLSSLRRFKDDVREVASGFECGIGIERFQDFEIGDAIEGFILEEIKRELA